MATTRRRRFTTRTFMMRRCQSHLFLSVVRLESLMAMATSTLWVRFPRSSIPTRMSHPGVSTRWSMMVWVYCRRCQVPNCWMIMWIKSTSLKKTLKKTRLARPNSMVHTSSLYMMMRRRVRMVSTSSPKSLPNMPTRMTFTMQTGIVRFSNLSRKQVITWSLSTSTPLGLDSNWVKSSRWMANGLSWWISQHLTATTY